MEYYSAIKKKNAICNHMDGPRDNQTKWKKSEKERQIPYDITYMWNIKYDTNDLSMKQKQTHRKQTSDCQGGEACGRHGLGGRG